MFPLLYSLFQDRLLQSAQHVILVNDWFLGDIH